MHRLAVIPLSLLLSGCFHLTGQVVENRHAETTRIKAYQRRVALPKRTEVALKASISDEHIRVVATAEKWCRTEHVEVFENRDRVTESLPSLHWAALASGILLAAGGIASWAIGADLQPPHQAFELLEPSAEAERDLGHVLVPIGISLTSLGGLILASHSADAMMLGEHTRPLAETHRKIDHGSAPCSREAAAALGLTVQAVGGQKGPSVTVTTDPTGKAHVSLLNSELWRLPYAEPFATIGCATCRPVTVTLPSRLSARLVLKRQRAEEMVSWLERHKDKPLANEVSLALAALTRKTEVKVAGDPKELFSRAKHLIRKRRYGEAKTVLSECVTEHSSHKGCRMLEVTFYQDRVAALKKKAGHFLRWRQPLKALIWSERCLQFDPDAQACRGIKQRAASRWRKASMKSRYRIKEVRTENDQTQVRGDFRPAKPYAKMYLAVRLTRGRKELCRDKVELTRVSSRRALAFQASCDPGGRQPDGVTVTVEGYRL